MSATEPTYLIGGRPWTLSQILRRFHAKDAARALVLAERLLQAKQERIEELDEQAGTLNKLVEALYEAVARPVEVGS